MAITVGRKIPSMPQVVMRVTLSHPLSKVVAVLVLRVWPALVAAYLLTVVLGPYNLPLYAAGPSELTDAAFVVTAATCVVATLFPLSDRITAAAFALVLWAFMGRAASFVFQDGPGWTRILGSMAYVLLALGNAIAWFAHAVLVVDARVRGGRPGT